MENVKIYHVIGEGEFDTEFIEKRRKELGFSVNGFAQRLERSSNSLKYIIRNRAKKVNHEIVRKMARILNCRILEVFNPVVQLEEINERDDNNLSQ